MRHITLDIIPIRTTNNAQCTMHNATTNNYQNYHTALINNRYAIRECNLQIVRAVEILEEVKIGKV